ncbi:hypothetical protein ACFX2I_023306 [Malus domestica]
MGGQPPQPPNGERRPKSGLTWYHVSTVFSVRVYESFGSCGRQFMCALHSRAHRAPGQSDILEGGVGAPTSAPDLIF